MKVYTFSHKYTISLFNWHNHLFVFSIFLSFYLPVHRIFIKVQLNIQNNHSMKQIITVNIIIIAVVLLNVQQRSISFFIFEGIDKFPFYRLYFNLLQIKVQTSLTVRHTEPQSQNILNNRHFLLLFSYLSYSFTDFISIGVSKFKYFFLNPH